MAIVIQGQPDPRQRAWAEALQSLGQNVSDIIQKRRQADMYQKIGQIEADPNIKPDDKWAAVAKLGPDGIEAYGTLLKGKSLQNALQEHQVQVQNIQSEMDERVKREAREESMAPLQRQYLQSRIAGAGPPPRPDEPGVPPALGDVAGPPGGAPTAPTPAQAALGVTPPPTPTPPLGPTAGPPSLPSTAGQYVAQGGRLGALPAPAAAPAAAGPDRTVFPTFPMSAGGKPFDTATTPILSDANLEARGLTTPQEKLRARTAVGSTIASLYPAKNTMEKANEELNKVRKDILDEKAKAQEVEKGAIELAAPGMAPQKLTDEDFHAMGAVSTSDKSYLQQTYDAALHAPGGNQAKALKETQEAASKAFTDLPTDARKNLTQSASVRIGMTNFIDAALRDPKQLGALGTYKAFAQSRGILEADPQLAQMYEQYSQTTLAALHSGGGFGGNYLKGPIHEAIPSIDKTILYNMYGLQAQADHWINTLSAQRAGLTSRHQLEALDDEIQMWKDVKSKYNVTLESGVSGQRGPSKGMAMPTKEYITFQGNVINKDFQVLLRKDKSYENAGHEKLTGAQLLSIARRKQLEPMYFYRNWITQ